jgi:3-oxoacyl-ACP reductase-like protein
MEEQESNKMHVSYGVESSDESAEIQKNPMKKSSKKTKNKQIKSTAVDKAAEEVKESVVSEEKPKKKGLVEEINEMKANNETRTPEFTKKMAELETILGVDEINPFGTNELDIFEEKLKGLSEAGLQDLAYRVGMNPYQSGPVLKGALRSEFKSYNRNNMRNVMPTKTSAIKLDPNNPQHAETIKILGEI